MPGNPDLLREYVATQRALVAHGAPPWPGSSPPSAAAPAPARPAPAPPPVRPAATTRRVAVRRIVSVEIATDHYGVDDIDVHSSVSQARTRKRIDAPRPFPPPPPAPDGEDGGMDAVRAAVKDQRRERRAQKPERQVANAKKAVAKRDGKKRGKYGDVKVLETFLEQAKLAPSNRLTVPKGIFDKAKARSAPATPAPAIPADLAAIATHGPGIGRHLTKARDHDRDRDREVAAGGSRGRSRSRDRAKEKESNNKRKKASKPALDNTNNDEDKVEVEDMHRTRGGGTTAREKDGDRRLHAPRPARRGPDPAPRRIESPVLVDDHVRGDGAMDVHETGAHCAREPNAAPTPSPAPRRSLRVASNQASKRSREPTHVVGQGTSTAGGGLARCDVAPVRHATPPAAGMVDAAVQMSPQSLNLDHHRSDDDGNNQDYHAADHVIIAHPPLSSHAEWPAWMDDAELREPDAWSNGAVRTEMSPTAVLIRELEDATRTTAGSEAQFMEIVEDNGSDEPAGSTWGAAWEEEDAANDVAGKPSEVDWREPLYLSGLIPRPPRPPSTAHPHVAPGVLSDYGSSWDVTIGDEVEHDEWVDPAAPISWALLYETSRPTTALAHFPGVAGTLTKEYAAGISRIPPCSQPLPSQVDRWANVPRVPRAALEPRIEAAGSRRPLPSSRSAPEAALIFRYRKHRLY
ncbi:hypothetical protein AMAG_07603 [Allomyces macrogynus ATCC 38327]|uniref:Uncharacterized protein n=1 Tax=Allomyces macrogynus (strain ATCC 38327) TaxID=578462 RepID=A0A0L0SJ20_ALLM3|nr:hypothetical protein AMAG_07603 [Allomyces macrogynus ATCC 38327]|eukprot:KNE62380.1 hypothetical protein AMAG_07603 [Allomyces macrogynus ATCC 38327]